MATDTMYPPDVRTTGRVTSPAAGIRPSAATFRCSIALAFVTAAASAATAFVPDLLRGPAVMNGSARGTAIVLLFATVPLLVLGMWFTARGSARGLFVWAGALAHVLYQSTLFLFATPFNEMFLLYVAMGSLALWGLIAMATSIDAERVRAHVAHGVPVRGIAIYIGFIVVANTAGWLARVIPELTAERPAFLIGTGLVTNPIFVQDLLWWLPLMGVAAWWLWHERTWGHLTVGAMLVMWQVESVTVALDQWMGHQADPASDVATVGGAWLFVVMALVGIVPLVAFFRHVGAPHAADPA